MEGIDHLQLGIDVVGADKGTDALDRLQAAMRKAGEMTVWTGAQAAAGLGAMAHGFSDLNRESGSFIANHPLLTASIGKVGFEVTRHISSVESATNAYRALRLAMSPTAFTAATLGTGFAVEELLRNAEKVASTTRKIAIEAAGSGMSFQQTLAMRTAGRIEGGDFSAVFAGKGTVEIAALAEQYRKLSDPVDKASFAVANFGDNAEKAMPTLRRGMEGSVSAANEFAGSVTKLDRESLERLSVQMNWYADMAHKVGAGFRSWWETEPLGRRWWAMMAAHENDRLLGTLAGQAGTVATGLAGNDTTRNFLSYLAGMPSFESVAKSKADAEWFQSKIIKMQPVESGVLSRSDAAMAAYSASQAGLQGKLSEAEATRLKLRDQLYEARGTDLETSIRQRILGNEQEIAGYKAGIKAIEDQAAAVKDLARQEEALAQLRKRSDEALMRATVGEDTPLAKYAATLGRVRLEQSDFSRLNPKVESGPAFQEQRNAAWFTLQADTGKTFIEFDKKGVELGKQAVEVADKLGRDTVKLGEDFYKEHPEIFGMRPQDRQFLTGFASPEQALRNAKDNERRALGLYGGQAALAGISEITQARTLEALRKNAADEEYRALSRKAAITNDIQAEQDAIDQQHQKYLDATLERQQALLQMALRQKQEFQSRVVGGVEALIHGQGAAFGQRFGTDLMDKVIGNLAGMGWKDISKIIPHASDPNSKIGQALQGTMFGADPLKGATDLNTTATDLNSDELRRLTAELAVKRSKALSAPTGSAGGYSQSAGILSPFLSLLQSLKRSPSPIEQIGLGKIDAAGMARDSSGLVLRGSGQGGDGGFSIFGDRLAAQSKAVKDLEAAQKAVSALTFPTPKGDLAGIEAQSKAVKDLESAQKAVSQLTFPTPKGDQSGIEVQVKAVKDLEAAQKAVSQLTFPTPKGDLATIEAQAKAVKDLEAAMGGGAGGGATYNRGYDEPSAYDKIPPATSGSVGFPKNDPNAWMRDSANPDSAAGLASDSLKTAAGLNTTAEDLNTKALDDLTALLAEARANAVSASGGGGGSSNAGAGFSSAASTFARIMAGGGSMPVNFGSGGEVIGSGDSSAGLTQLPSGLWQRGPVGSDAASGAGVAEPTYMPADLISGGVGFPKNDPNAWMRGGGMTLGKGVGIAGAAVAGGFGIYSGIHAGGAQGALTAAGSAAAMAGGITSLLIPSLSATLGPIGMALGMGFGIVSTLLGDPKKNRANEMDTWLQRHQFSMPDPVSIERDTRGRDVSYNMQGNLRPIQQPTPTINDNRQYHVSAIDSQDVSRFFANNAAAVNKGVARAIDEGGEMVPKLASAMGLQ